LTRWKRIAAEKNISVREAAEILEKSRKDDPKIDTLHKMTVSLKKIKKVKKEETKRKEEEQSKKKKEKESSKKKKKR
jgi:hypothetical protein